MRRIPQIHSIRIASKSAVLIPELLPTAIPVPAAAVRERAPHETAPAIEAVPFTWMLHVPGQLMVPSSQALATAPLTLICPVLVAGAQMSSFEQERSPGGHQADPGQLAASAAAGAAEHGAANQVRLLGASAVRLGGQT